MTLTIFVHATGWMIGGLSPDKG